jgi:cell division protein FtsZ
MKTKSQISAAGLEPVVAPAVKIIGIGSAGVAMLEALHGPDFAGAELAAINTDAPSLAASSATVKVQLETRLLRGLGTGGDPERGRAIAEEHFATLKTACAGAEVVLVVTGLGGGAGSGISPVVARAAKES